MNNSTEENEYIIKSPARIRSLLRSLIESHQLVSVNLDYTDISSISVINEIARDGKSFLLDGVRSNVVNRRITEGKSFSLTTSLHGVEIRIEKLRSTEVVGEEDSLNYRVDLPAYAHYFQRRQTFRAPVPDMANISPVVQIPVVEDGGAATTIDSGTLTDLSASGCAIIMPEADGSHLVDFDEPITIRLELKDNAETLDFTAYVRHCKHLERVGRWRIGFEFSEVPPATRHRIDQLNASLQLLDRQRCA